MKNLYNIAVTQKTTDKSGFDYKLEPIILRKSLSPNIYENDILAGFLDSVDNIVVNSIESVKRIRIFNNFTVSKEEKGIN